jgi:hypothetical protein
MYQAAVEATTGDETRRRTLLKLCDTRWVEKHTSVLVFRQLFGAIAASLEHLEDTGDSDTRADARAYLLLIIDVEFAVVLIIVAHVFAFTKPYSEQLQAPSIDLVSCYKGVEQLAIYLSELQYDTSIRDKLFVDLTIFLTEHNISSTPCARRRRMNKTCREIFDNAFDTLLSNILDELGARFSSHQMVAIRLCLLLPVEVRETLFLKQRFYSVKGVKNLVVYRKKVDFLILELGEQNISDVSALFNEIRTEIVII